MSNSHPVISFYGARNHDEDDVLTHVGYRDYSLIIAKDIKYVRQKSYMKIGMLVF